MCKRSVTCFISKLYLILPSDIVRIKELTMILKIISQYDVKYVMVLPIKTITSVLKVLTYIITGITITSVLKVLTYIITSITITSVLKVLTYIITDITKTLCQFECVYLFVNL